MELRESSQHGIAQHSAAQHSAAQHRPRTARPRTHSAHTGCSGRGSRMHSASRDASGESEGWSLIPPAPCMSLLPSLSLPASPPSLPPSLPPFLLPPSLPAAIRQAIAKSLVAFYQKCQTRAPRTHIRTLATSLRGTRSRDRHPPREPRDARSLGQPSPAEGDVVCRLRVSAPPRRMSHTHTHVVSLRSHVHPATPLIEPTTITSTVPAIASSLSSYCSCIAASTA